MNGRIGKRIAAAQRPIALPVRISAEDIAAHRDFVGTLGDTPLWRQYLPL
jgi:DNA polymerase-3 subunit epsilon